MAPEEQDAMHASQQHADQTATPQNQHATCSYPLETLMTLQKWLEDGIPEHAADEKPGSPVLSTAGKQPQPSILSELYEQLISATGQWGASLRELWWAHKKAKKAPGKGNSAQQTG